MQTTLETRPMITLTNSVINPSFIEEAYTQVCTRRAYDGGWLFSINGTEHWSPTSTVVVLRFASGRTSVYGGDDANTLWLSLHGTPAYVEAATTITVEGHGIAVSLKGSASGEFTFSWCRDAAPGTAKASALLTLLVERGYADAAWLENGTPTLNDKELQVQYEGKHTFRDTVMKATV
jgi:hypothetical protein